MMTVFMAFSVFCFAACGDQIPPGNDDIEIVKYDGNYEFSIAGSCDEDKISLRISNTDKTGYSANDTLDVVMLKPYEYYDGETERGIYFDRNSSDAGTVIGTYNVDSNATLTIDRYDANDYDNLYNKFILAKDNALVAGPFYVSDIESERTFAQKITADTKKGVIDQGKDDLIETGCGWTEYNINPNAMIYPNEYVDSEGNTVAIDNSSLTDSQAIPFVSNGKTYYFRKSTIDAMDNDLIFCKNNNIKVVYIIYNQINHDQTFAPYYMAYPEARDYDKNKIWALDTSTELGAGYFTAAMEFMAERYSRETGEYGYVHRFVIGNEIDLSSEWNALFNYNQKDPLELKQYVEEYARTLRIAEQATKKYYDDSMVLVSTCHSWNGNRTALASYSAKSIYDYLNAKISYQGNYNWGMAGHPYPKDLSAAAFLEEEADDNDLSGNINDSLYVTWTNLEILDIYLAQDHLLYNGEMRRVYLTEGGVSSGGYNSPTASKNALCQAAGIAYAYYKAVSMDCIDAFIYYKLIDSAADGGGCNFGIYTDSMEKKISYEVFKYMDTQYSFDVANQYLSNIKFRKDGTVYSVANGNITSYRDIMDVCDSGFDWDAQWSEAKIMTRNVDTPPQLTN